MTLSINLTNAHNPAKQYFREFWTKPASATPLAALRIGTAGVLLFQAIASLLSVQDLFGPNALISWHALMAVDSFPLTVNGLEEAIRKLT